MFDDVKKIKMSSSLIHRNDCHQRAVLLVPGVLFSQIRGQTHRAQNGTVPPGKYL